MFCCFLASYRIELDHSFKRLKHPLFLFVSYNISITNIYFYLSGKNVC